MNHQDRAGIAVLMWACGARIAVYQLAMVSDQLIWDDEQASSTDDSGGQEDFRRLGFLS